MSLVSIRRVGAVAVLKLEDGRRRNILSPELCRSLSTAVANVQDDPDVKAIVVAGAAPAFCAGADLDDLKAAAAGDTANLHAVYQSFLDIAGCPLPTIAAINGAAVGAGMNLALACDLRIAAHGAVFDTRFLKIGLHPGGGHGWMLLRAVSWAEATRLLLLGRSVNAEEALRIGLVQRVVTEESLLDDTIALARGADALPRELIVATKASLRVAAASDHPTTFAHETGEQLASLGRPPLDRKSVV